ncbi:premnaspirodiene oxygenase [Elaeis guineensis]|uniref:Premnaspirodiene oxygenase n=1 Tax=Elaeis guineensis var. tenera TaxID=51953 RepID=A0A6I9R6R4_ELAGV|nr:premnaspirodiene oxygenase [Elaeis guineensis]
MELHFPAIPFLSHLITPMELQFPTIPFLSLFLLFAVIAIKLTKSTSQKTRARKLPPSPWRLPIIGHLHHLVGAVPHRALRELSLRHGPLMHLRLGQVDHIVVSSPEAAKEILTTHDLTFASRTKLFASDVLAYGGTNLVFAPYGSYWRLLRKICVQELLSPKRVNSFRTCREEEMSDLVGSISTISKSPVNLSDLLFLSTKNLVSRVAFGKKCKHGLRFHAAAKEGIELVSGLCVADLFPSMKFIDVLSGGSSKASKVHQEIDKVLEEIIKEHQEKRSSMNSNRGAPGEDEDLVDVLLDVMENGKLEFPLALDNIKAVILDMFLGGTDTASTTLEWAMSELARHPEAMQKAQAEVRQALKGKAKIQEEDISELHYMKLVIKETLRLHPPVPLLLPRDCSETCELEGYDIPMGSRVIINVWAIARDARYWGDAESFRPERFYVSSVEYLAGSFEYLPFGGGRRVCPGFTFGMAHLELALANLLFYFDWKLPHGIAPKDLDMEESMGATVSRKSALWLIATPHEPI